MDFNLLIYLYISICQEFKLIALFGKINIVSSINFRYHILLHVYIIVKTYLSILVNPSTIAQKYKLIKLKNLIFPK